MTPRPGTPARGVVMSSVVVFGRGLPLQIVVEPAPDVLLVLDPARGRSTARELVVLARKAHHHHRLALLFERAEHGFALRDGRAPILLAVDDQKGCGHLRG